MRQAAVDTGLVPHLVKALEAREQRALPAAREAHQHDARGIDARMLREDIQHAIGIEREGQPAEPRLIHVDGDEPAPGKSHRGRAGSKAPTTASCSSNTRQTEALMFDNGRLKQATYDTAQGFGLRAVKDEAVGYAHSSDVSLPALIRAADAVRAVQGRLFRKLCRGAARTNVRLYGDDNPLDAPGFEPR
jgi:hypothetical protein